MGNDDDESEELMRQGENQQEEYINLDEELSLDTIKEIVETDENQENFSRSNKNMSSTEHFPPVEYEFNTQAESVLQNNA